MELDESGPHRRGATCGPPSEHRELCGQYDGRPQVPPLQHPGQILALLQMRIDPHASEKIRVPMKNL